MEEIKFLYPKDHLIETFQEFLAHIFKRPFMYGDPKIVEYSICLTLELLEICHNKNVSSSFWKKLWIEECKKQNKNYPFLRLAILAQIFRFLKKRSKYLTTK